MRRIALIISIIALIFPMSAFSAPTPITSGPLYDEAMDIRLYLIQAGYPIPEFTLYQDTLSGMEETFSASNSNSIKEDDVDPAGVQAYAYCNNQIVVRDYINNPKYIKSYNVNIVLAHEMLHLVSGTPDFCVSSNFDRNALDIEEGVVQQTAIEQVIIYRYLTGRSAKIPVGVQLIYYKLRANVIALSAVKTGSRPGSWVARNWRKQLLLTPPSQRNAFIQNS